MSIAELVQGEGWTQEESLWRSLCSGHQEPFSFDLVWHDMFRSSYSHVLITLRPQSKAFRRALVTELSPPPSRVCSHRCLQSVTRCSWHPLGQYQYSLGVVAEVRSWNPAAQMTMIPPLWKINLALHQHSTLSGSELSYGDTYYRSTSLVKAFLKRGLAPSWHHCSQNVYVVSYTK